MVKDIRRIVAIVIIVSPFVFIAIGWGAGEIIVASVFAVLALCWEFGDKLRDRIRGLGGKG